MFQIELKRIQASITAGRLDDAFETLQKTPLRGHFDGQRLTSQLVDQLITRAEGYLENGLPHEAKLDARKALRLAGQDRRVIDVLKRAEDSLAAENSRLEAKRGAASAARIQVGLGQFTLGQRLLPPEEHPQLFTEIARKREIATDAASRLQRAIETSDLDLAFEILGSLDTDILRHRAVVESVRSILRPIGERLTDEIRKGRLHQASILAERLSSYAENDSAIAEGLAVLDRCRRAAAMIDSQDYSEASRELGLVEQLIGPCEWLRETKLSLKSIADCIDELRTSPLNLMNPSTSVRGTRGRGVDRAEMACRDLPGTARGVADSYLLRVDGVGSILLLDADRVSIGPFSKSKQFDVPIQSGGSADAVYLRRTGEDYFAESDSPFSINERPLTQKLLASGDSIAIGRRGRIKFRKAVPASGTATLQLTGAALSRREIRHVALMSDSLLFAPTGGHFPLPGDSQPIVMFRTRSGYSIKFAGSGIVAGVEGDVQSLEVGRPVQFGDVRFSLNSVVLS